MKRVAVIADSHFCETSRFDECVRLHDWIAADIVARNVDLVLHAGDVFHQKSTPKERMAVAQWLSKVTEQAPVLIVRGNHDFLSDLPLFARLEGKHPVIVEEAARVHTIAGVAVAAIAWPRKGEMLICGVDHSEAMPSILTGLGDQLHGTGLPSILLMHAMVRGSKTSAGQPLIGCDFEVSVGDLERVGAGMVVLGHIHKHQSWNEDLQIVYAGSPRRTEFGDIDDKGYLIVDMDCESASWQFVKTPATPMLLLEADWVEGQFLGICADNVAGSETRLRYNVDVDQRDNARASAEEIRARLLANGAVMVKLEEVVSSTVRARCPEISAAKTISDKLVAHWASKGVELAPERKVRVLARLGELE